MLVRHNILQKIQRIRTVRQEINEKRISAVDARLIPKTMSIFYVDSLSGKCLSRSEAWASKLVELWQAVLGTERSNMQTSCDSSRSSWDITSNQPQTLIADLKRDAENLRRVSSDWSALDVDEWLNLSNAQTYRTMCTNAFRQVRVYAADKICLKGTSEKICRTGQKNRNAYPSNGTTELVGC